MGEIIHEPNEEEVAHYRSEITRISQETKEELENADNPAITVDGHRIEIAANVGNLEDTQLGLDLGAEGIGLLRTEFLYLERQSAPDEEEQYQAYKRIFELMGNLPIVVRTLDVGGDKVLPYLNLGDEPNPFLGWRAIRMSLDQDELFKTQLRALLKAGSGYDLRIMFPMVTTLDEIKQAKAFLVNTKRELVDEGVELLGVIQIGIMVEVPSVVVLADQFAKHVDFFSIGTNDLAQYTMAADRTNEKVAFLNDAIAPAILRQVAHVIDIAHAEGIWVGLCGELAGDPDAIPILVGLGIDELSMVPRSIPHAKAIIRRLPFAEAKKLAEEVIDLESVTEVRSTSRQFQARFVE
jgi:phosphotransferase system enzyme I (PtsI)